MKKQKNHPAGTKKQGSEGSAKKRVAMYIDTENVSYKKGSGIMAIVGEQGELRDARAYGLQKDRATQGWSDVAKKYAIKDIRLCGAPQKNKVDKKIQRDIRKTISNGKDIDIICIVSSDQDYVSVIRQVRAKGKQVIVIGEKKASDRLRKAGNIFREI